MKINRGLMITNSNLDEPAPNSCDKQNNEQQKSSFVAALVHDLRNPAIAEIRALEVLLNGTFGMLNSKQLEIIEILLSSAKYMNNMLASVLEIYRYNNGVTTLDYDNVNFKKLIQECIEELKVLAKDRNLKISCKCKNSDFVECDRTLIKRVIINILSNQIKFAFKNSKIQIKFYNENENNFLTFENSSPYISDDKIVNIFDQYVTYSKMHNLSGSGIGLYASKKIIEAHNGKIFAKSFKQNQNIFGFCLPKKVSSNNIKQLCF